MLPKHSVHLQSRVQQCSCTRRQPLPPPAAPHLLHLALQRKHLLARVPAPQVGRQVPPVQHLLSAHLLGHLLQGGQATCPDGCLWRVLRAHQGQLAAVCIQHAGEAWLLHACGR
jgi:hypothetical protein